MSFRDDFDGPGLDRSVWLPHYLPAWSSRDASAATFAVEESALRLSIPPSQGLWCEGVHASPLRVSGVQSGNRSGPVGSTSGQQPFLPDQAVREEQETFRGWLPQRGRIEVRAAMTLSPRSMASVWLVGFEEDPAECAEICVFEVFGDAVDPGVSAAIGSGLHAFRDPRVPEDFDTDRLPLDVSAFHTYAVDWSADRVAFSVDGTPLRACAGPPSYAMQVELAVFDFPDRSTGDDDHLVPELVVDRISGT